MTHSSSRVTRGAVVSILACLTMSAQAADLTVFTAGAFKQVVSAAAPEYEKASGNHVVVENDTAGALAKRVEHGDRFDLLILPGPVMKTVSASHHVRGIGTPLASVGIGVAVREGAPKPDISTVAAFKQTVLDAREVAYIDPAAGGSSGIYVATLLERLGVADTLKHRTLLVQGGLVGDKIADGSATLAIHQLSELRAVKGITVVGPLPESIQSYTTYVGAVSASSSAAAQEFLALLSSPSMQEILTQKGMVPPRE